MQGIYKQGLYKIIAEITGAGELSKDCHKSLSIKEGVSYFPFDYAMCKFITDLFFTNVGLVFDRLFTSETDNSFQEWHKKGNVWIIVFFSRIALCLLHLSTCITGRVYDQ